MFLSYPCSAFNFSWRPAATCRLAISFVDDDNLIWWLIEQYCCFTSQMIDVLINRGCSAESLLLGSLLWLVGTVCLFTLPQLPQSTLEPVPRVAMEEESPGSAHPNGGGNNDSRYSYSSLQTRRCRATRTRMKQSMWEAIPEPSAALISI